MHWFPMAQVSPKKPFAYIRYVDWSMTSDGLALENKRFVPIYYNLVLEIIGFEIGFWSGSDI